VSATALLATTLALCGARAAHAHDAADETVQPVTRQAIPEAAGEHGLCSP
jgi:hypothetical protein